MRMIVKKRTVQMSAVWAGLITGSLGVWYLIGQFFVWLGGKAMAYL